MATNGYHALYSYCRKVSRAKEQATADRGRSWRQITAEGPARAIHDLPKKPTVNRPRKCLIWRAKTRESGCSQTLPLNRIGKSFIPVAGWSSGCHRESRGILGELPGTMPRPTRSVPHQNFTLWHAKMCPRTVLKISRLWRCLRSPFDSARTVLLQRRGIAPGAALPYPARTWLAGLGPGRTSGGTLTEQEAAASNPFL
jgi:hypothetical protein